MWKDTDFCSKRDDDSAIGDSENNSAEEESMNSRRKSSISDDIDEMTTDAQHAHLASKLGAKIPECLLKSSEEIVESCRKHKKSCESCKIKAKREIKVLPNAASVPSKKSVTEGKIPKENTSLLDAKLQYLLSEMVSVCLFIYFTTYKPGVCNLFHWGATFENFNNVEGQSPSNMYKIIKC